MLLSSPYFYSLPHFTWNPTSVLPSLLYSISPSILSLYVLNCPPDTLLERLYVHVNIPSPRHPVHLFLHLVRSFLCNVIPLLLSTFTFKLCFSSIFQNIVCPLARWSVSTVYNERSWDSLPRRNGDGWEVHSHPLPL